MKDYSNFGLCSYCRKKFEKIRLLQSTSNTYYCPDCFKDKYNPGHKALRPKRHYEHKVQKRFIPSPEIYMQKSPKLNKNSTNIHQQNYSQSAISLSKKPIQCPHGDCNKYISIFTLESHFQYEHKEVPIIITQLDARSALEFYPRDIRYGVTQCIVLFNVIVRNISTLISKTSIKSKDMNNGQIESKPVMVLLVTRIAGFQLATEEEQREEIELMTSCPDDEDEILRRNDKIIIWLSSNVQTNFNYTVAASTQNNDIRLKYFGPLLPLGDTTMKICSDGKCLILCHYHCTSMTENGTKPLTLDVVIHSDD